MRIPGEPGIISAAAGDLQSVISQLGSAKGDLDRTANNLTLPGHWTGEGASSFAAATVKIDDQLTRFGSACEGARQALDWYAGQLAELQREAEQLNQAAAAQGLSVDDNGAVHGPVVIQPAGAVSPQASLGQQAQALLQRAKEAADTTRRQLDAARESMFRYNLQPPWATPWGGTWLGYDAYTSAASAYSIAKRKFEPLSAQREDLLRRLERASSAKKARHWEKELKRWNHEFDDDLGNAEDAMNAADRMAGWLKWSKPLALTLDDVGVGARLLRNVPLVGIGLTAWQAESAIADGADPTEEITADTTALVAGSVAADLAVGLAIGLGATAGLPIVAGLAAGAVVAWGAGEAVHWFFHTDAGRTVAHAVDTTVGDVAHAVGSGISHTWHSIFG